MSVTGLRTWSPTCAALFHEFGHALQHMLTEVEYGLASGIRGIEVGERQAPAD